MLTIQIEKQTRFDLPEGWFDAQITGLKSFQKQSAKGAQQWCRINFDVDVPTLQDFNCKAGRGFLSSLKPGTDLYNFLIPVLGVKFFTENSAKTVDLEKVLVGMKVKAQLRHYQGGGFEKPLTIVEQITLPEEEAN